MSKRRPAEVFVSYAHRDRRHLDQLRIHLAGLARNAHIRFWWDGELELGKEWEPQIVQALRRANVVILLLSANFMASTYCIEKELEYARLRERKGELDLIPILAEPFDVNAHWLGRLQAITTADGKPITLSRSRAAAWEKVAKEIRLKIECFEGGRPVMQALNETEEAVHSGTVPLDGLPAARRADIPFFSTVTSLWKADRTLLRETSIVSVQGTFSHFAPMLMGPPLAKRELHREFRKAIERNRTFSERKRPSMNACLSISAGQMVHREVRTKHRKRLLGLYESIVRNALPIFVLQDYYEKELLPAFLDASGNACYEAIVTGRLFVLDNDFVRRFVVRQGLDRLIAKSTIDNLCNDAYALEVGGPGTKVRRLSNQPTRYLDGDIWLALKSDRGERFVTDFVDIGSKVERQEGTRRLRQEAGGDRILASYDELNSISRLAEVDDE